jgi:hypothetical protein
MSRSPVLGKNHHFISGDVRHHAALHRLKLLSKIHKSIKDSVLSQNKPIGTRPATAVALFLFFDFEHTVHSTSNPEMPAAMLANGFSRWNLCLQHFWGLPLLSPEWRSLASVKTTLVFYP